jgi:hypothetical protein
MSDRRDPRKPGGYHPSSKSPRGRPIGYSPVYSPDQTRRYKSQALRYSKAVELAKAGPDFVQVNDQILSSDRLHQLRAKGNKQFEPSDRLIFGYYSDRSNDNFWRVRFVPGGEPPPPPPDPPGTPPSVYDPFPPPALPPVQSCTTFILWANVFIYENLIGPDGSSFGGYPQLTNNGWNGVSFVEICPGDSLHTESDSSSGSPLNPPFNLYTSSSTGTYMGVSRGGTILWFPGPFPGSFGIPNSVSPTYSNGWDITLSNAAGFPLASSRRTNRSVDVRILPIGQNPPPPSPPPPYTGGGGGGGGGGEPESTEDTFECDCPDYTKSQGAIVQSRYNSEQVGRSWQDSAAGCDPAQGCKHVIATRLFLGLPVQAPTDIP